jgi:hypothetical protein
MSLSLDSVRALERHFVGTLTLPSRLWLDAVPLSHLVVTGGEALRSAGDSCALDLGIVDSPGTERQIVRIASGQPEAVDMKLREVAPWLAARWLHGAGNTVRVESGAAAEIEIVAAHDVLKQTDFAGTVSIGIRGGAEIEQHEELLVRMTARRTHALGAFDFHGSPQPRGLDFGVVDPLAASTTSYDLAFDSLTSVPLTVAFADLPAWLTFDVDDHRRPGPASGRFFERTAPFKVSIRPRLTTDLIGVHRGSLRLETNDPRPELRSIDIRFAVRIEPAGPFLRSVPDTVRIKTRRPLRTEVRVENWGRTPALITAVNVPSSLQVLGSTTTVPAASGGRPGVGSVPLRVMPAQLSPGARSVAITFSVEGGTPLHIQLPLHVAVTQARKGVLAPAAMAALFALLAFAFLFVLYLRVVL